MSSPPPRPSSRPENTLPPPAVMDSLFNVHNFAQTHAVTIAATSAAVTSVICGYPFDSIKTRMQAYRYESSMHCIRSTFYAEGLAGFYRGVLPIAASISVLRSISFSLYNGGKTEILRMLLPAGDNDDDAAVSPLTALLVSSAVSGAFAGSVVATLNAPIDFIKLQKQLERIVVVEKRAAPAAAAVAAAVAVGSGGGGVAPTAAAGLGEGAAGANVDATAAAAARDAAHARRAPSHGSGHASSYAATPPSMQSSPPPAARQQQQQQPTKSTTEWARHIVNIKGPTGLYAGYSMHLIRDAIGTAFYFSGYEFCKHVLSTSPYLGTDADGQPRALTYMLAGGIAGSLSWLVLFPIDITKSVLQREALQHRPKYLTALQFVTTRWRKSGIRGFYNGIGPQLVRSFPVHSINFLVYENVVRWCRAWGGGGQQLE
ncbi:hypothetical protein HDU86_003375 [Geranomyces michiganensis]|nr:hypothetical protein HDU86_003375 [Geranomyces michiganensis]